MLSKDLFKIKEFTAELIEELSKRTTKFTNREYQHLNNLIALNPINDQRFIPILRNLICSGHQPIFCYEVKDFLSKNDKEIYKLYIDSFINNPGVEEGFDGEIKKTNRTPFTKKLEVEEIKLLDPVFIAPAARKRKDNFEKKKIRRNTKIDARNKIIKIVQDKKAYDDKVKHMYSRINSNK